MNCNYIPCINHIHNLCTHISFDLYENQNKSKRVQRENEIGGRVLSKILVGFVVYVVADYSKV